MKTPFEATERSTSTVARAFLPLLLLLSLFAHAGENDALRLSGFGTLGYAQDDRHDMAALRDLSQKPKDGFKSGPSWLMDSRLGVQLEYRLSPIAELVGQAVLRDHVGADFNNSVELAYLGLKPHPQMDVRVGRLGYDAFLMSDHRNVGYAYSWVRPPTEFYGWIPIFSVDGLDATYRIDAGEARWRIKAQAGATRLAIPLGGAVFNFVSNNLWSLSATRLSEHWRIKAAYSAFSVDSEVSSLVPLHSGLEQIATATLTAFPQISAEATDLKRQLSFKGSRGSYATLGATYDDGLWFTQAEFGHATSSASIGTNGNMGYLGVGRRWGDWAPYARYSIARHGNAQRTASTDWRALGLQSVQNKAISILNSTQIQQSTATLGLRWDFHKQMALKLQWDASWIKPSGYALWWRDLPLNERTSRVNLVSASLDFVF